MSAREPLHCDCHGTAKLAERKGGLIVIRDRQYGQHHTLVIDIEKEYNRLKKLERLRAPEK